LAALRAAPGRQKSYFNLSGPPEMLLQLGAIFSKLQHDFWRRGAPGHQKSCCNLLQNPRSCNESSGGAARRDGPAEILLQLVAKFSKLQQDFWRPGAARRAARNLATT